MNIIIIIVIWHLCMPKIISWIKKKKTGQYKFFNSEKHKLNEKENSNYIVPSEGVEIKEEIINIKERKKINIYIPTYHRYKKTKASIEDIIQLSKNSIHDIQIYIGDNNSNEEMKEWLRKLKVNVYFSEKNIGKSMIINYMHKNIARQDSDYVFSIDSDMRKDNCDDIFDKMIVILETCANIGLVASNQSDLSQHWYGKTVTVKNNRGFNLGYTNNGIGVSGGCICMRTKEWNIIGGYKENHAIYTGDDSILTYNVFRKLNKEAVVAHDYYLRHPKPADDEKRL